MIWKKSTSKLAGDEVRQTTVSVFSTCCLVMAIPIGRINGDQNYLILQTLSDLLGHDLERTAYGVADNLSVLIRYMDRHSIESILQTGKSLPRRNKANIFVGCTTFAYLYGVGAYDGSPLAMVPFLADALGIPNFGANQLNSRAIQDTGFYNVMGFSEEHRRVKPVIDNALHRAHNLFTSARA